MVTLSPLGGITSFTTLSPGTFMVVSFCFDSKDCWYNSAFPLNGGLYCNTLGQSLLSSEPASPREITSVPILSPDLFVEVSPPFATSDSGSCWFSVPISGSGPSFCFGSSVYIPSFSKTCSPWTVCTFSVIPEQGKKLNQTVYSIAAPPKGHMSQY